MSQQNLTMGLSGTQNAGVAMGWAGGEAVAFDAFLAGCASIGVAPPSPPKPASCLERAMADLSGRDKLSRPYSENADGKRTRGHRALVDETVTGRDLSYSVRLRAEVSRGGMLSIFGSDDQLVDSLSPQWAQAEEIRAKVEWHSTHLSSVDVKAWLIMTIKALDGTTILCEERGGSYYVPPKSVPMIRKVADLVRTLAGIRCRFLPCVADNADTIDTLLGGLDEEFAKSISEAVEQCAEGAQDRTFRKHGENLQGLRAKLTRYEEICNTRAESLRNKLATVEQHVAMAALGEMGAAFPVDLFPSFDGNGS